jgi:hypothetical protein
MNMPHSPILATRLAELRQQELQHEAKRWHSAKVAESANKENNGWRWTELKGAAARIRSVTAHLLSSTASRGGLMRPAQ